MSHYYTTDKTLKENKKTITFELDDIKITLSTDSGVFSRKYIDFGTSLLLKTINLEGVKKIIDMGCGYGVMGIYLAKKNTNSKVYMYDINEKAIELSNINIKLNKLNNIDATHSNFFEKNKELVDLIVCNPPIRAGKKVIYKIYEDSYKHLLDDGRLVIVIQKKQGALSSIKYLETIYPKVEVLERDKGFYIISSTKLKV